MGSPVVSDDLLNLLESVHESHTQTSSSLLADMDKLIEDTQRVQQRLLLNDGSDDTITMVTRLKEEICGAKLTSRKPVSTAVTKLSRGIDKAFPREIENATFLMDSDSAVDVEEVHARPLIIQHYCYLGNIRVVEALRGDESLRIVRQLESLHSQIVHKRIDGAFDWAFLHRDALRQLGSPLYLRLSSLVWVHGLFDIRSDNDDSHMCVEGEREGEGEGDREGESESDRARDARLLPPLEFARTHFVDFIHSAEYSKDVFGLLGCLPFARQHPPSPSLSLPPPPPLLLSRYPHLFQCDYDSLASQFRVDFLRVSSFPSSSPLFECVDSGVTALPTLMKFGTVMKGKKGTLDEIPAEIDLGRDRIFHSIFSCPVSREQTSSTNPPMLLVCGHVIAK